MCGLRRPGLILAALALSLAQQALAKAKFPGLIVTGDAAMGVSPQLRFGADDRGSIIAGPAGVILGDGDGAHIDLSPTALVAGNVNAAGDMSVTQLTAGGFSQWKLVDLDTFDADDSNKWSANAHSFCGNSGDFFLGGHCKFANQNTSRTYELPPHTRVMVTARVHYFDEWHGESVVMALDSQPTWAQSHNWCPQFLKWMCKKYGVDSCGRDMPDRLSTQVSSTIAHTAPSLTVSFSSSLSKDADSCAVSWGVDDVAVHIA